MGKRTKHTKRAATTYSHTSLKDPFKSIFSGLVLLLIIGIFYSTAITTIATIGLIAFGLKYSSISKLKELRSDAVVLPFFFVFLVVFLSGTYSDDQELWLTALRLRLPFLLLPLSFFFVPKLPTAFIVRLIQGVIYITALVGLPVLFATIGSYDEAVELIAKGKSIATPIEHVKYSMFNAYAIIAGIILLGEGETKLKSLSGFLIALSVGLLFVLIHLLSVRTGLVIVYISVLTYMGYHLSIKKDLKLGLLALAMLVAVPIIAVRTVPSLKQKMGYMIYDWNQGKQGNGANYSDGARMLSYQGGVSLWLDNPFIGTGYGDVKNEMQEYYNEHHPDKGLYKLPHSQFLLTIAGSGLVGFLLFVLGFYTPLLTFRGRRIIGFLLFYLYLNYSLSFLVENSLERSMSVAYFLVIGLLLLQARTEEKSKAG